MISHSGTETGQQKELWGWGLEVTGKLGRGGWIKFEKGGRQYREGVIKEGS